jgi:phosphoserine aminotransferase
MSYNRIYNFSAGPAMMPVPVLEQMQRDLLALPGVGMSVLEISHRSRTFESILEDAETAIRKVAGIPAGYRVLFVQGGASLQFSMVPMNFLSPSTTADYIDGGSWADKAIKEAQKLGGVHVAASTRAERYVRIPADHELTLTPGAAYVHITSNNTIEGTQYRQLPQVGAVPLVSDASSDLFSRPIDVGAHALIYAGAQKNMGPAGVTIVIVRDDLVAASAARKAALPTMLNYALYAESRSLYNTPPVFAIYAVGLVMRWLAEQGGLEAIGRRNEAKAAALYAEIDRTGFYRGTARADDRSMMNVTFRLLQQDLEKRFVREAAEAGLDGLEGHRSVGGIRASLYNAFPEAGVAALVGFMREFERRNG